MHKRLRTLLAVATLATVTSSATAEPIQLDNAFMVGVHLGELPWGGSFKPGLSVGYYLSELIYFGALFQVGDSIRRDGTSFNVQNTGLDGVIRSSEEVAARGFLGVRVRPHRYAPFAAAGLVYNGADSETMVFDARNRTIGSREYEGAMTIRQTRPAALRPALGLGYSYEFDSGIQLSTAWSGWLFEAPKANVTLDSETRLDDADESALRSRIAEGFGSTITNKYHLFHIGAGYVFGG